MNDLDPVLAREGEYTAVPRLDPWAVIKVIDRLEVGPIRLERNRLAASYQVHQYGDASSNELIYRYEEEVFDPGDPASLNLASMIAAQVALNYGLFAREIVLHGLFDGADRRFLEAMLEGTAREIYVKKFLQPNPFLRGEAAHLSASRRERYSRARLLFPDVTRSAEVFEPLNWSRRPDRVAVLASGGKDSLLSYGLLEEMGLEAHSVFLNESGRHWYTALNGHRHLKTTRPDTTVRVWTTSDRVFSWMLRHLPFVRPDYSKVRSDDYPIRLWTVAVFLFGALPILRKRAIGRLVIGDEYDTTIRRNWHGIPHYDGLYDQSRYFDDELSRYYRRKAWPLCQFSLLRPLSELLIQKILVRRYPQLHPQQVSCHAAHMENERVFPCGRCEKCRRIVGMLLALDADPSVCGYTEERVAACIAALGSKGIHQESEGAEELAFLLVKQGLLAGQSLGLGRVRERPEILRLRFHPEKSPPHWIPLDLRKPLLQILLQYADGAVGRRERSWLLIDPLDSSEFFRPYPFEQPFVGSNSSVSEHEQ